MKIKAQHERNLRYLAAFLAALPDDYDSFHMNYFCARPADHDGVAPFQAKKEIERCGTVACAVGHLPLLGYRPSVHEDYTDLSMRLTGLEYGEYDVDVWEWCFSGDWSGIDNTPLGAAKRIIFMLTANWEDVKTAIGLFDEVSWIVRDLPEDHNRKECVNLRAIYEDVAVPALTTLDLSYLPRDAGLYAARQSAGEPVLSFLANHT